MAYGNILFVISDTGGGHRSAAEAMIEAVRQMDGLAKTSGYYRRGGIAGDRQYRLCVKKPFWFVCARCAVLDQGCGVFTDLCRNSFSNIHYERFRKDCGNSSRKNAMGSLPTSLETEAIAS